MKHPFVQPTSGGGIPALKATSTKRIHQRAVACPECGAGTGEKCRTKSETTMESVHRSRQRMAIRAGALFVAEPDTDERPVCALCGRHVARTTDGIREHRNPQGRRCASRRAAA